MSTQIVDKSCFIFWSLTLISESGFSNVGILVGATNPKEAILIRKVLPKALFLIPGYGAQGAKASEALKGLIIKNKVYEGGLINSSRNILFPKGSYEQTSLSNWKKIIQSALKKAKHDLTLLSDWLELNLDLAKGF